MFREEIVRAGLAYLRWRTPLPLRTDLRIETLLCVAELLTRAGDDARQLELQHAVEALGMDRSDPWPADLGYWGGQKLAEVLQLLREARAESAGVGGGR